MPRRKTQSVGEVLIGYFTVCSESDAQALLLTAKTIVAARFPPPAKPAAPSKRKPRAPKAPVAPGPSVEAVAVPAAAAPPSTRRPRPPVAPPTPPTPAAGQTALGQHDIALPDQGDPADRD